MKVYFYMAFFGLCVACATAGGSAGASRSYLEGAKSNFEAGEKALKEHRYEDAIAYFEHVRDQFAYSSYAAWSDLRIADAYFEQGEFDDAAYAYDFFIRFHPRHEKVADALFQMLQAHYQNLPKDFFLVPKSYTKDQASVRETLQVANRFVEEFPKDRREAQVKAIQADLMRRLVEHDLYVARFYQSRGKWKGALLRYESVAFQYPQTELAAQSLWECAQIAKNQLSDLDKARGYYQTIKEQYPQFPLPQAGF